MLGNAVYLSVVDGWHARAPQPAARSPRADLGPARTQHTPFTRCRVAKALSLPGFTPLFLVGHDVASLEWLAQHAQRLQDLGASGLAVEVADAPALRRIQAAAPGVDIWPVSGDDIAERLELQHYPVLITPTGLEQ